ncbi:hypothetical protein PTI98_009040 [Pleurotus ostreatus]|nr:hypothetical protein PTI98_009040 [Pleurotus ostreatus]
MSNLPLEAMPTSRSTRPRWRDNCVARVHSVCPHGAFCLLGNHAMANGVEYTQLVPRALSSNNKLVSIIAHISIRIPDEQAGAVLGHDAPHSQSGYSLQCVPMQ